MVIQGKKVTWMSSGCGNMSVMDGLWWSVVSGCRCLVETGEAWGWRCGLCCTVCSLQWVVVVLQATFSGLVVHHSVIRGHQVHRYGGLEHITWQR